MDTLEALGERLKRERIRVGLDQRELAVAASVSRNSQLAYEGGKTPPPADYLLRLQSLGIDTAFVLTGGRQIGDYLGSEEDSVGLPEIDIKYSMGSGLVVTDHVEAKTIHMPRNWLKPLIKGSFKEVFVARGDGDSMQPTLLDQDIVVIDTAQKTLNSQDRIWCCAYGDIGMIKRLRSMPDGSVLVSSDNTVAAKPYPTYDGELHIIGRVIWIGRRI